MADDPDIKAYPFQFDPSQFANPYTQWNKQALPFMGQYAGGATGPTDAHGNPIQSYQDALAAHNAWQPPVAQGMTLNSSPQSNVPQYIYNPGGMIPTGQNTGLDHPQYIPASYQVNPAYAMQQQGQGQQQTAAKSAAPAAPAGPDMNAAYLAALANPGKVTTPGATVAQSAPPSASSGVLQQFLANWKPGANSAGTYNPNLFPDALRGMV